MKVLAPDSAPTRRCVAARTPHGVSDHLIITTYPDGQIGIREFGRPFATEQRFDSATLYVQAIVRAAMDRPATRRRRAA